MLSNQQLVRGQPVRWTVRTHFMPRYRSAMAFCSRWLPRPALIRLRMAPALFNGHSVVDTMKLSLVTTGQLSSGRFAPSPRGGASITVYGDAGPNDTSYNTGPHVVAAATMAAPCQVLGTEGSPVTAIHAFDYTSKSRGSRPASAGRWRGPRVRTFLPRLSPGRVSGPPVAAP